MDIQSRKIEFIQSFLKLKSEDTIAQFELLLKKAQKTERNIKTFTIEELNERISKSENDFENNRFKTSSELLAKF